MEGPTQHTVDDGEQHLLSEVRESVNTAGSEEPPLAQADGPVFSPLAGADGQQSGGHAVFSDAAGNVSRPRSFVSR